ncbi:MAG: tRNA pseudouridine(55) synthase TruB [Planctomycetes bacterium]|nr:tRNA pseudouridine(55) synthase TruB [Planctomycetota bacterium]
MIGLINLCKPPGPTSHDMVAGVRKLLPGGTKVGHAGTLDPFASGVLMICVGPAVRLAEYIQQMPKRYQAGITLGAVSPTDDPESPPVANPSAVAPTPDAINRALAGLIGEINQVPPAHSAIQIAGRRAYSMARKGRTVELQPRPVHIHSIELLEYDYPRLRIDVRCGSGTYIRALARDIGSSLGVGGFCSALARTAIGPFNLAQAVRPEELDIQKNLLSPLLALQDLPKMKIDPDSAGRLVLGNAVRFAGGPATNGQVAILFGGKLLAIGFYESHSGLLKPSKVLAVKN